MTNQLKETLLLAQQVALAQMHIELIGKVDLEIVKEARDKALAVLMKSYEA